MAINSDLPNKVLNTSVYCPEVQYMERFITKLVLWYINKNDNKTSSTSSSHILITAKALDFIASYCIISHDMHEHGH